MDLTVISTYRCNSKCSMCNIWKNPTSPLQEVGLPILEKLPNGFDNVNITGGEPTLRDDLLAMCEILYPKAKKLEISTNGLRPERLEEVVRRFPSVKIRISLEGFHETNDTIRGERGGFDTKVRTMSRLKALGGADLGFASVIQDDNINELLRLYEFTRSENIELATSALHNAFQFHKGDNWPYDRLRIARQIENLIAAMLSTGSVKNWFRAYLNLGLIRKTLGHKRFVPCKAGTHFMFVDPWSDVYACNVRPDLLIGNLDGDSWDHIITSDRARQVTEQVNACSQNCWMVTTARASMRNPTLPMLPKLRPLGWVIQNKIRVTMGMRIPFQKYVDYDDVTKDFNVPKRSSSLGHPIRRTLAVKDPHHYDHFGPFENR
jgi:Fe-coproporphyrin III synthase